MKKNNETKGGAVYMPPFLRVQGLRLASNILQYSGIHSDKFDTVDDSDDWGIAGEEEE